MCPSKMCPSKMCPSIKCPGALPTYLLDIKATLIALFTGCKTLPDTKTSKSVDHLEAKLFFAPLIETHFQMSACPV